MWREPKLNDLNADTETKNLIAKSIYFNRKGFCEMQRKSHKFNILLHY